MGILIENKDKVVVKLDYINNLLTHKMNIVIKFFKVYPNIIYHIPINNKKLSEHFSI